MEEINRTVEKVLQERVANLYRAMCDKAKIKAHKVLVSDYWSAFDNMLPVGTATSVVFYGKSIFVGTSYLFYGKPSDMEVEGILAHEQGHLDLFNGNPPFQYKFLRKQLEHLIDANAFNIIKHRGLELANARIAAQHGDRFKWIKEHPTFASRNRRLKKMGDDLGLPPLPLLPR